MTDRSRSHFVVSILPHVKEIAARRASGIENAQDREDAEANFVAEAWQHFVRLTDLEPEPSLGRVLCALYRPEPVWTHRPEPDVKILSMGNPRIRQLAEAVPA